MNEKVKLGYLEIIQKQMNTNHWIAAAGVLSTVIMVGYYLATTSMFGGYASIGGPKFGTFNGLGVVIVLFFMWFFSAYFWDRANRYRGLYEKVAVAKETGLMTLEVGKVSKVSGLATLWSLPVGWFYIGAIVAVILPILR